MQDSSDPSFEQLVSDAFVRFESNLRAALPRTAPQILEFLHGAPQSYTRKLHGIPEAFLITCCHIG